MEQPAAPTLSLEVVEEFCVHSTRMSFTQEVFWLCLRPILVPEQPILGSV